MKRSLIPVGQECGAGAENSWPSNQNEHHPDLPCCHSLPLPLRDLRMARYDRDAAHKSAPAGVRVDDILLQTEKALEVYTAEYLKQIKRRKNKVPDMRRHWQLCTEVAVIERRLCGKPATDRPWFAWTTVDMDRHLAKAEADEKLEQARLKRLAAEHVAGMTHRPSTFLEEQI